MLTDGGTGPGSVDIETGSELTIIPAVAGNFTFDPLLTGTGTLSARLDADTSAFEFSHNVGDQFAGTLKLGTSSFALEGLNTSRLTHAMLMSETGNITTVGSGVQQIGGLGFNGGTLILVPLCRAIPLPATVLKPLLQVRWISGERHNSGHHAR